MIERRVQPSRSRMANRAILREFRSDMVGHTRHVCRVVVIRSVAPVTICRQRSRVIVRVACRAENTHVRTREGERSLAVIESCG